MTLWLNNSDIRYLHLVIVRKGDISGKKAWLIEGMKEEHVYLVDVYEKGLETIETALLPHLSAIESRIKN